MPCREFQARSNRGPERRDFVHVDDVARAFADAGRFERIGKGAGDIVDMDEVAALFAILEDHRPLAIDQPRGKDRQHSGIGIGQRLAGAIDVEQPEADTLHAIGRGDDMRHLFLNIFVERIDRSQRWTFPFGRRDRGQRASAVVHRIPVPLSIGLVTAPGILHDPAIAIGIKSLAIDAHRTGGDDAAHRAGNQLLHQHRRAGVVGAGIAFDIVHRLADADLGREMNDGVDTVQCPGNRAGVADVALHTLGIGVKVLRPAAIAVHLRDQAIEHADPPAPGNKQSRNCPADKPGTTGNKDCFRHE